MRFSQWSEALTTCQKNSLLVFWSHQHKAFGELLVKLQLLWDKNRTSPGAERRASVPSFKLTLGLVRSYSQGEAVSRQTLLRPRLCRVFAAYFTSVLPAGFVWTSVAVNGHAEAGLHVDHPNAGLTAVQVFGTSGGGELWVHDPKPAGSAYNLKAKPLLFNAQTPHATLPTTSGSRWTCTLYKHAACCRLSAVGLQKLKAVTGFRTPTLRKCRLARTEVALLPSKARRLEQAAVALKAFKEKTVKAARKPGQHVGKARRCEFCGDLKLQALGRPRRFCNRECYNAHRKAKRH